MKFNSITDNQSPELEALISQIWKIWKQFIIFELCYLCILYYGRYQMILKFIWQLKMRQNKHFLFSTAVSYILQIIEHLRMLLHEMLRSHVQDPAVSCCSIWSHHNLQNLCNIGLRLALQAPHRKWDGSSVNHGTVADTDSTARKLCDLSKCKG